MERLLACIPYLYCYRMCGGKRLYHVANGHVYIYALSVVNVLVGGWRCRSRLQHGCAAKKRSNLQRQASASFFFFFRTGPSSEARRLCFGEEFVRVEQFSLLMHCIGKRSGGVLSIARVVHLTASELGRQALVGWSVVRVVIYIKSINQCILGEPQAGGRLAAGRRKRAYTNLAITCLSIIYGTRDTIALVLLSCSAQIPGWCRITSTGK